MRNPYRNTTHKAERAKRISALRHVLIHSALWILWTGVVAGTAAYQWSQDVGQQHPLNVIALILHCLFVGVLGIILIEDMEFWLEEG